MNPLFKLKSIAFKGSLYYLNTTTEAELRNNISSYLHYIPKNHIYSLLTPELIITNNKRLDFATDIAKFKQQLPKKLREKVGTCKGANLTLVELKRKEVNVETFVETVLSCPTSSKRYINHYEQYCNDNEVKVKTINLIFVAPKTMDDYLIDSLREDLGVLSRGFINLKFKSYIDFYSEIYDLMPWYIKDELSPLLFSIDKGKALLNNKLAIKE